MFIKITSLCLVMAAAVAELHDHGHSHAYSSQAINVHHETGHGHISHGHIGNGHIEHGYIENGHYGTEEIGHGHIGTENIGYGHESHHEPLSHHGDHTSSGYHYAPVHRIHEDSHHGSSSFKSLGSHNEEQHIDYYAHPKYEFEYSVKDPHTGDIKSQHEHRDGDKVQGVYSLHDPHGNIRTVKYNADKKTGFNAIVKQETIHHHQPHHHHY